MTKTYASLKKQIETLQALADALKAEELAGVVGRIKEAIAHYDITAEDLGLRTAGKRGAKPGPRLKSVPAAKRASTAAKYANETGQTWGGRGPHPAWLREALASGRTLEEFAVGKARRRQAVAEAVEVPSSDEVKPASKRKAPATKKASEATKAVPKRAPVKKASPATRRRSSTAAANSPTPSVDAAQIEQQQAAEQQTQGEQD